MIQTQKKKILQLQILEIYTVDKLEMKENTLLSTCDSRKWKIRSYYLIVTDILF